MGSGDGSRIRGWLWRYGPAEVAATAAALVATLAAQPLDVAVLTAYAGAIGEGVAFYAVIVVREWRARRCLGPMVRDLLVEFGPAEALDSFVIRPAAMLVGPMLVGHLAGGVLLGKVFADAVFYGLAIISYELRKAAGSGNAGRTASEVADTADGADRGADRGDRGGGSTSNRHHDREGARR